MTLITLLIVLTIERIATTTEIWQFDFYYAKYKAMVIRHFKHATWLNHSAALWLWVLLPTLVVGMISQAIDWLLIDFIFNLLVLMVCIGCVDKRKLYKSFLNAANRNDEEACQLYAEQLKAFENPMTPVAETETEVETETETEVEVETEAQAEIEVEVEPEAQAEIEVEVESEAQVDETQTDDHQCRHSLGLTLVWYNFKYYCAVLFWFVCLGPTGAVLYCMVRQTADDGEQDIDTLFQSGQISALLHLLNWLPARICSAGYLLIGDFNRSAGIWLSYLLNLTSSAKDLICDIAEAAETVEVDEGNKTLEPALMLKLAKRNILFFLALVALLTLYGGIA